MKGTIKIIGYIGQPPLEDAQFYGGNVTLVDIVSQVKKYPNATSFDVIIDSPGGSVQVGWDIYNYLKSLGLPIHTYGNGMVASISSVLFMLGQKRTITEGTQFMIHLPMGSVQNANTEQMKAYMGELQKVEDEMVKFYSSQLDIPKEAILPILRDETYLDYEQLRDLGFVTEEMPMKISACAKIEIKPEKMTKEETKSLFSELMAFLKGKTEFTSLIRYTATQEEVDFYELGEDAEPSLGAMARIDGRPANGEYAMADGRIFVFREGELVQIKEDLEEPTLEEVLESLAKKEEELKEANSKIAVLTDQESAMKKEKEKLESELIEAKSLLGKFQALESKFVALSGKSPEGRKNTTPQKKEGRFAMALQKLQESQKN